MQPLYSYTGVYNMQSEKVLRTKTVPTGATVLVRWFVGRPQGTERLAYGNALILMKNKRGRAAGGALLGGGAS